MNNTITLSQLITRLAEATNVDNNTARRFLRALFASIGEELAAGQTVTLKSIGTFRPIAADMAGRQTTVAFTPDPELAAELNRPFEMFAAVELADGLTFDEPEEVEQTEAEDVANEVEDELVDDELVVEQSPNTSQPSQPSQVSQPVILWPEEEEEPEEKPLQSTRQSTEQESAPRSLLWLWITLAILAVCALAYLAAVYTTPIPNPYADDDFEPAAIEQPSQIEEIAVEEISSETAAITSEPEPGVQTTAPAPTPAQASAPAKQPVYDTVEISLIRLAKKHYGESTYWVFIYEANTDIISNPERIRPGTQVLIPDPATFPGANTAETKAIAKQKQTDILARFK